ncbi:MAG: TIGR00366 family protein [Myxococcota bacterium]
MRVPRPRAPDTALVIFALIVVAAGLGWVLPAGRYETTSIEVPGVGARDVVIPGSYTEIDRASESLGERLVATAGLILRAPFLGFVDPEAAPIIAFVLVVGGAFSVLQKTGAIDAALHRLVRAARRSPALERALVPTFMAAFSLAGAVFGMAEEVIPFVPLFVSLALALGYDEIVGTAIPIVGAGAGFAAAFLNPFTVGVAQGIAGVPLFSGVGFRLALWGLTTAVAIAFVMRHGARVRRLDRAATQAVPQKTNQRMNLANEEVPPLTARHRIVLGSFFAGIALLVYGVLAYQWYITEIATLFFGLGIVAGTVGGLGGNGTARAFMAGARDLVGTALIIALARGILVVMREGEVVDTVLYALASALEGTSTTVAAMAMFGAQTTLNFFVPSGSGQAALTMPLMAPLADLLGMTRQTAVLAFQLGDGFTNLITPTNAVLMGAISLSEVSWTRWARWILPLQLVFVALGAAALALAVHLSYGP